MIFFREKESVPLVPDLRGNLLYYIKLNKYCSLRCPALLRRDSHLIAVIAGKLVGIRVTHRHYSAVTVILLPPEWHT